MDLQTMIESMKRDIDKYGFVSAAKSFEVIEIMRQHLEIHEKELKKLNNSDVFFQNKDLLGVLTQMRGIESKVFSLSDSIATHAKQISNQNVAIANIRKDTDKTETKKMLDCIQGLKDQIKYHLGRSEEKPLVITKTYSCGLLDKPSMEILAKCTKCLWLCYNEAFSTDKYKSSQMRDYDLRNYEAMNCGQRMQVLHRTLCGSKAIMDAHIKNDDKQHYHENKSA